nr:NepR family anti-sigma factor [Parapontixanthobacter aurantiacus]
MGQTSIKRPAGGAKPEWADGLRHMYDSVVDEELPDSFKDLLSKLDKGN